MKLAYRAYDTSGKEVEDVVEAANPAEAMENLRRKGLFVKQIQQSDSIGRVAVRKTGRFGRGRRLKNLATFTRQLYVLVASGTSLVEALSALKRQTKDSTFRAVIDDVRLHVEEGNSLAEAMDRHPEYFDAIYRSLIAAGESSGKLMEMLDRLAMLTKKSLHLRNSVIGALIYPSLVLVICVGVLVSMLTLVVPRFAELFDTLDAKLPPTTQALIAMGELTRSYWWVILAFLVAVGASVRYYLGTPNGKRSWDTLVLRLPQVRTIVKGFVTARIVRLLGVLLEGGVSILEAIRLTRSAAGNVHYRQLLEKAEEAVTRGEPISTAFVDSDLVSPSVCEAIRNGELTGRLGELLLNVADFQDEDNDIIVRSLTSIIEPVILVALGLLVGLMAVSLFMPLFDLTSMTQGGGT